MIDRRTLLIVLLRISSVGTLLAFFAMLIPADVMADTHARLGLGVFPRSPLVDYLTRSIAALYGFHGVFVWIVSTDTDRYRAFVWYIVAMNVTFGAMMLAIDVHAGMPAFWTAFEGPSLFVMGAAVAAAAWR